MKVMVVSSNMWLRAGLVIVFEDQSDIEVVAAAGSTGEAVQLARGCQPDVTVIDTSMPDLDGIETTWQIREENWDARIVMVSNHSTAEYVYKALEAGAKGYVLIKESDAGEIVAAVRSANQGSCYLDRDLMETLPDILAMFAY